jgi:hypothetical protein
MKTVLMIAVTILVLVSGVSLSESKEKKKKVTSAPSSTSTVEPQPVPAPRSVTPAGWTDVKTKAPQLARVLFKIDGRDIIVRFANVSEKAPVRIKYTVRWKKGQGGQWVDDATMEGISFRLKPLEELEREIRTRAPEIRDVNVEVEAAETS